MPGLHRDPSPSAGRGGAPGLTLRFLISRLFPVFALTSFVLPSGVGWWLTASPWGALAGGVWAGIIRMALLHHVTWSISSICHMVGRRPYTTKDFSANVAAVSILSVGESWHNSHHAHPASARHGMDPHQVDSSAALIRLFERAGWATKVRWPARGDRDVVVPAG